MSDLPAEWARRPLESVAVVIAGQSPPSDSYNSTGVGVPFFQGKAEFGSRYPEVRKYTTAGTKFAEPGDVLLSVRAPVGPTNLAREHCAIGRGLMAVRARVGIDERFLLWAVRSRAEHLADQAAGSTFAAVTGKQVRSLVVPVPPPGEQRRIVDILEDHLSRLDAADRSVEFAERRAALLEAALLTRAVSSGMDESTLGELALSSGYGTSTKCVLRGPGPAVVRIPNVSNRRIDLTDEKRVANAAIDVSSTMLSAGDLLIVRTNGSRALIGRSAVVDEGIEASFASYLIRYQLDRNRVRPEWVSLMLSRPQTRGVLERLAASSAGQYNLSLSKLDGVGVPAPRLEEQDRVILEHSDRAENLQRLQMSGAAARSRSSALRRALLAAAFSGKLTGATSDAELIEELADER